MEWRGWAVYFLDNSPDFRQHSDWQIRRDLYLKAEANRKALQEETGPPISTLVRSTPLNLLLLNTSSCLQ
jgi:hypothetical protein